MPAAPGREKMIMHARMSLPDGSVLMASDAPAEHFSQAAGLFDLAHGQGPRGRRAQGSTRSPTAAPVNMPFSKTFWAKGFGMCVDKFGIPWMVNCPGGRNVTGATA